MQSPKRDTLTHFLADLTAALCTNACPKCGGGFNYFPTTLSVHASEFGESCAGVGRVIPVFIPFCVTCEDMPADGGCVHTQLEWVGHGKAKHT